MTSKDAELRITTEGTEPVQVRWSLPFRRDGFYDADAHRLYLSADSLESQSYRELFRKFVGGTGHAKYIEELKRVNSSHPSAFQHGTVTAPLWLGASSAFKMVCDRELGCELHVEWPQVERLLCQVEKDSITFSGALHGIMRVRLRQSGTTHDTLARFEKLSLQVSPDVELEQSLTGKRVSLNLLLDEFFEQAIYFYPDVITGGDWLHGAVSTHQLDDERSPYVQKIHRSLIEAANIGYDRCGHFGLMYCWGDSPNYGDGGFLAPSIDARQLHVNWVFICSAARHLLMTGKRDVLRVRRARWLALNDEEPLCGGGARQADPILVKGDWRLDFSLPTRHTLGQSFTANTPWRKLRIKLGNTGNAPAQASVTLRRDDPAGDELASRVIPLTAGTASEIIRVELDAELPAGRYHVELSDTQSGRKWDGGLCWWTEPETQYSGGAAYNGPFHGDLWELMQLLFDYGYDRFGPRLHGVAAYDRSLGCGPNKSGRIGDPIVCVSYWEQFGGGKDMWSSLWYSSACSAMAELARWQGLETEARRYEQLRRDADAAFHSTFGREIEEDGQHHFRYVACVNWDGHLHDYGHTHYNLEAVARHRRPASGRADPALAGHGPVESRWRSHLDRQCLLAVADRAAVHHTEQPRLAGAWRPCRRLSIWRGTGSRRHAIVNRGRGCASPGSRPGD